MTVIGNVNTQYIPQSFLNADGTIKPEKQAQAEAISAGVQARIGAMPETQKEMFISLVQAGHIDLAPTGEVDTAALDTSLNRLEGISELVSLLAASSSDVIDLLARVMVEQANEQRKQALDERLTARESARSELMNQAGEMKDAAQKLKNGAIAALVVSVVLSAVAIVGAAMSMKGAASAGKQLKGMKAEGFDQTDAGILKKSQFDLDLKKIDIQSTQASIKGTLGQIANQLGQGSANFASTWTQSEAKEADARGSVDAAEAQDYQALADTRKEVQQGLDELVKSIISFLKEMKEAKAEMARAFTKV